MDAIKDWLYPSTQIGAIVRFRPLSLELFYRRGMNPWRDPEMPVSESCLAYGVNVSGFLRDLAELPASDPGTHWEERPCYHLIDFLTEEHRAMLHTDVPAIRYLLDIGFPEAEGGESLFLTLTKTIGEFSDRLRLHQRHEEEEIFPGMLINEFRLMHQGACEDMFPSARKIEAASRLLEEKRQFERTVALFLETARPSGADSPASKAYLSVGWLIKSLGSKLRLHARLETDALFPMTARVERELLAAVPN